MLAIVSSNKKYFGGLLEKVDGKIEDNNSKHEIYKCKYKGHNFVIMSLGYGKVNIGSSLNYLCS